MRVCLCVNYNMAGYICIIAALCVAVSGAPPSAPRLYAQHAPAHLQNINPLDYFTENSEVANYYNQAQQKQGSEPQGAPARLESLEPDSEVELIPGAQQPQQPPQQTPVSPHLPGIAPGQRVFIVQMPIPGYRPGTIGGYQPVYIVAAAPQGNPGYPANGYQNGYQNAILLNPSGQAVISPYFGYQGVAPQPAGLVGALPFNRPFEQVYQQDPAAFAFQPAPGSPGVNGRPLHLSQLLNLQGQQAHPANSQRTATNESLTRPDPKRVGEASDSEETKEAQEQRRARPTSAHAQSRNKV